MTTPRTALYSTGEEAVARVENDLIAKLENASRLLDGAKDIHKVHWILSLAGSVELFARRRKLSEERIAKATEILS
jgi:hypothetical protein